MLFEILLLSTVTFLLIVALERTVRTQDDECCKSLVEEHVPGVACDKMIVAESGT